MSRISIEELIKFCRDSLVKEGMDEPHALETAEALTFTDAWGVHSHGVKNLYTYIKKGRAGGVDFRAMPEVVKEGGAYAVIDAHNSLGMVASVFGMNEACRLAETSGIAIAVVKNSCHFGAAGYYSNIAARRGFIGLAMSNTDSNMSIPGTKGKTIGNNPFSFAAPSEKYPSLFLDIALSAVAALKVIQADKDGKSIPDSWLANSEGMPTTDPGDFFRDGALLPMAMHKGYGLAVLVDVLSAMLSGSPTSSDGTIPSWHLDLNLPNGVSHTFIAINPFLFRENGISGDIENMSSHIRGMNKASGFERVYTPGEIEWEKYRRAESEGIELPPDVELSLRELSSDNRIELKLL
ncbi:MAG: Ldh family oxidoreductase [Clostridia bacterium]|nr:Ldh family oxidoreductase [Clostridia bacterium]